MAFSDTDRRAITTKASRSYISYWHVMHPVTFKPKDLYRAAWPDDQWDAVKLLLKEHEEAVTTHHYFHYEANFSKYNNRPAWLPAKPHLTFQFRNKKQMPFMLVKEKHVGPKVAMEMRRWILKAYHFRDQKQLLHSKLHSIVHRFNSHTDYQNRTVKVAEVNTPRILHGVWPECTPFMDSIERGEVRNNRNKKYPIPRHWDEAKLAEFHEGDEMAALNNVLLAVGMIEDCTDNKYPSLSGR